MACVPVTCCELFLEHLKIPCSSFFLGHIQDLQALSKQTGNEFEPLATAFTKWYAPWGTIKKRYFVLDAYFCTLSTQRAEQVGDLFVIFMVFNPVVISCNPDDVKVSSIFTISCSA